LQRLEETRAAAEAAAQELRTVREERTQLQEKLGRAHDELRSRLADGKRLQHLTEQFNLLQMDRDQLRSRVADQERALAAGETARIQVVRDLDEAGRVWQKEREELRTAIGQLQRERNELGERFRQTDAEHREAVERLQAEIHNLTAARAQAEQRQEE